MRNGNTLSYLVSALTLGCAAALVACSGADAAPTTGTPGDAGASANAGEAGRSGQGGTAATNPTTGAGAPSLAGENAGGRDTADGGAAGATDNAEGGAAGAGEVASSWTELTPLPTVATAYSFALAANADGEPRLGFMFLDDQYRQALLDQAGVLWDGGGVYTGSQVLAIYEPSTDSAAWQPYQGRLTPQTYRYSQLTFNGADSYYTTSFPAFGGLVSVVKNGGAGAYALTPAFTDRRAHSVGFLNGALYALVAQKSVGLTLATFPVDKFGSLDNVWQNIVTLAPDASSVTDPALLRVGDQLVAGYVLGGHAVLRRTSQPQALALAADFSEIGGCDDAAQLKLATRGTTLYRACISATGELALASADLAPAQVTWTALPSGVVGSVATVALAATRDGVALAVRQDDALRVFDRAADLTPSLDAVMAGDFDLLASQRGLFVSVCDLATGAEHTLHTFRH